jgi:nuclear mRNA export protein SAC3
MRVYHRLIHIRDQKERHEDIPSHITAHPVFKLTTDFRRHVQQKSAPISKTSPLVVDAEAMAIFGRLAAVLDDQGSVVMIYLVACILERLFGKETVEDIEAIRGELTISDIIDGISTDFNADDREMEGMEADDWREEAAQLQQVSHPTPSEPTSNGWLPSSFTPQSLPPTAPPTAPTAPTAPPVATSAFAGLVSTPNVFGTPSIFGGSVFSNLNQPLTNKADDREADETDELEPDDWQEDATEPQQVPPSTQLKPSSDGWLSSSFTSQPSTAPAPTAPPVAIPAFTGLISTPNIFDKSSIFGNSLFSGLNQPPTSAASDTQPQVGFDGPVASTSIPVVPTPPAVSTNPALSAVWGGDISTADDRVVDEVDATEADSWHEDATELQQVSPSTQLKPSLDGWLSSSFTSQPSTAPAPTAPPVAIPAFTGLVSTPNNIFDTASIFGNSTFSGWNQPLTSAVSDTQPQVGFDGPVASTSISVVPTPPAVSTNPAISADWGDFTVSDITGSISTADDRVVDEVEATEADATELQQVSKLTSSKPSSNGWSSSSFTSQPSSTTPILTPPPVANTSGISGLVQRKRARRRISSQYHPPRTDEELAKRFKEVQSVLVACFSTTFNGPDGFSFFPSWLSFDAYIYASFPES